MRSQIHFKFFHCMAMSAIWVMALAACAPAATPVPVRPMDTATPAPRPTETVPPTPAPVTRRPTETVPPTSAVPPPPGPRGCTSVWGANLTLFFVIASRRRRRRCTQRALSVQRMGLLRALRALAMTGNLPQN